MKDKQSPCTACGESDLFNVPIAPTAEAIDDWIARRGSSNGWPSYGVNIRTKSGSWRCITGRGENRRGIYYWTIRGEGSSNGGRDTHIYVTQIVAAQGFVIHYAAMEKAARAKKATS